MLYVIDQSKPFNGRIESSMRDDVHVDYSGALHNNNGQNLTLAEYREATGEDVKAVSESELDSLLNTYYRSLVSNPSQITAEQYDYALEVLPPCKFGTVGSVTVFHMLERLTGNMVSWYANLGGKYYECTDYASKSPDIMAQKFVRGRVK